MRRIYEHLTALALAAALGAAGAFAQDTSLSQKSDTENGPRALARIDGNAVEAVAEQYGLRVVGRYDRPAQALVLVEGPPGMGKSELVALVGGDGRVADVEPAVLAALPAPAVPSAPGSALADVAVDLSRLGISSMPCTPPASWNGWADQQAAGLVRLGDAHATTCGDGALVAVIDTGVDPDHPILAGALAPGFDFLAPQSSLSSEWQSLDQSVMPIVESLFSQAAGPSNQAAVDGRAELLMLDASMAPILDPDLVAELEGQDLPPYFGHGTMVAGLVRLAAPGAKILPLRVFNGDGTAQLFDIVAAIYVAVESGADVINMSFSMPTASRELQRALRYARDHGVVCVAAAGNGGERTLVYPAAFAEAVGVAATDLGDELGGFSNRGSALVTIAAPGVGVISTYPGGLYAAGWGTSFSTPLVSGTVALLQAGHPGGATAAQQSEINALKNGAVRLQGLAGEIGSGRLDTLGAILAAAN